MRKEVALATVLAFVAVSAAAAAEARAPAATLSLEHRVDTSRGTYIEGAYYYAALRRSGFSVVRRFNGARLLIRVAPGRYVLRSYARPCDGNCSVLDPPYDGCATRISLRGAKTLRVRIVAAAGSPCRLRIVR